MSPSMTRLHVDYHGFKLGLRVADGLALSLDVQNKADVLVLHKLKNMGYIVESLRIFHAFGINGETYAPKD